MQLRMKAPPLAGRRSAETSLASTIGDPERMAATPQIQGASVAEIGAGRRFQRQTLRLNRYRPPQPSSVEHRVLRHPKRPSPRRAGSCSASASIGRQAGQRSASSRPSSMTAVPWETWTRPYAASPTPARRNPPRSTCRPLSAPPSPPGTSAAASMSAGSATRAGTRNCASRAPSTITGRIGPAGLGRSD